MEFALVKLFHFYHNISIYTINNNCIDIIKCIDKIKKLKINNTIKKFYCILDTMHNTKSVKSNSLSYKRSILSIIKNTNLCTKRS